MSWCVVAAHTVRLMTNLERFLALNILSSNHFIIIGYRHIHSYIKILTTYWHDTYHLKAIMYERLPCYPSERLPFSRKLNTKIIWLRLSYLTLDYLFPGNKYWTISEIMYIGSIAMEKSVYAVSYNVYTELMVTTHPYLIECYAQEK